MDLAEDMGLISSSRLSLRLGGFWVSNIEDKGGKAGVKEGESVPCKLCVWALSLLTKEAYSGLIKGGDRGLSERLALDSL